MLETSWPKHPDLTKTREVLEVFQLMFMNPIQYNPSPKIFLSTRPAQAALPPFPSGTPKLW